MAEKYVRMENVKNGVFLGMAFGAALLWGDKIKGPIINFLNGIRPEQVEFLGSLWAPLIVLGVGALIGFLADRF